MVLTSGTHYVIMGVDIPVLFLKPLCMCDVARFEVEVGADGCISDGFDRASEGWNTLCRLQTAGKVNTSNRMLKRLTIVARLWAYCESLFSLLTMSLSRSDSAHLTKMCRANTLCFSGPSGKAFLKHASTSIRKMASLATLRTRVCC